eukprot:TRINITY_DN11885_c0_g1_i1.p1 TRINITY_DN11885_c0_g1~~TRINITY_DN11885_c0_g1_i1.p1  ORF type:complete len:497 (+),score=101.62 TRINITY_DN11885_c0_g1_i1:19-1509(+)
MLLKTLKRHKNHLKRLRSQYPYSTSSTNSLKPMVHYIKDLKQGITTSEELVNQYLYNIENDQQSNAFISVRDKQKLMNIAKDIDNKRKNGSIMGALNGTIVAIKDNFNVKNTNTTCASKMLQDYKSPYTATICQKIIEQDGIIIGKTNMDEFGMGSLNKYSHFGPTNIIKNNEKYSPGGSSGGSAVAVATGLSSIAIGSDTGGSVRLPAAWCGIVGLKPSYGLCSRYGLVAYGSSFDTPSILSLTVEDSALMLNVISGFDKYDSTSVETENVDYSEGIHDDISGTIIGIPKEFNISELSKEQIQTWEKSIEVYKSAGAKIVEVSLPNTSNALAAYYILTTAEASSNLSRYDGMRYGHRVEGKSVADAYTNTRGDGFGAEVKRRILTGTYVLQQSTYKDFYQQAMKIRRLIKNEYNQIFNDGVDAILCPVSCFQNALKDGEIVDPVGEYVTDCFTVPANLAGIPAVSVPFGGGMQLMGGYMQEKKLLNIASKLEINS